jgi:hypothetical protein
MSARWSPSVTVAAIIERDGCYLLVEEETPEGLRLNNPAGHLDPGESPEQGVVREALEETARVFVPDRLVGVYLSRFRRPATPTPRSASTKASCERCGCAWMSCAPAANATAAAWYCAASRTTRPAGASRSMRSTRTRRSTNRRSSPAADYWRASTRSTIVPDWPR